MGILEGRIVVTKEGRYPYKVVFEHEGGESEYPVSSIREGETLIRSKLPSTVVAENKRERGFLLPRSRLADGG